MVFCQLTDEFSVTRSMLPSVAEKRLPTDPGDVRLSVDAHGGSIWTIEGVSFPRENVTFKKAPKAQGPVAETEDLPF